MPTGSTRTRKRKRKRSTDGLVLCLLLWFAVVAGLPASSVAVPGRSLDAPVVVGPDLVVSNVRFGYFDARTGRFVESNVVDSRSNPSFGWRVEFEGSPRTVRFREEFVLPAPAAEWGVGPQTVVAPDRASAVTTGKVALDGSLRLERGWTHQPGDPTGPHRITVWVNDVVVAELRFVIQ